MKALHLAVLALFVLAFSCRPVRQADFVQVRDGVFVQNDKKVSVTGTNFWYGAILASEGRGGDRVRLQQELDTLKALGINNLRVLVGGDGEDGVQTRIEPTLQQRPLVYNDTIFRGLDYLLAELGKRQMKAVLYVNNSWEWSGGYGQYMEWASHGKALIPAIDGYGPFMEQMAGFATDQEAQALFFAHLRHVVSRTNTVTGLPYQDDPAIFAWQIGNEPRCFSADPKVQDAFVGWLGQAARIIKEIDPNHLVSSGNEGSMGCEGSLELYRRIHEIPDIDYLTIHIWPYNWGWVDGARPQAGVDNAIRQTGAYIREHRAIADELRKPLVLEEFGFPRDDFSFSPGSPTQGRNQYYTYVYAQVAEGLLDGANFWGWAGYGVPAHENWQRGDDYTGDPAQEAQGLNSVFLSDTETIRIFQQ